MIYSKYTSPVRLRQNFFYIHSPLRYKGVDKCTCLQPLNRDYTFLNISVYNLSIEIKWSAFQILSFQFTVIKGKGIQVSQESPFDKMVTVSLWLTHQYCFYDQELCGSCRWEDNSEIGKAQLDTVDQFQSKNNLERSLNLCLNNARRIRFLRYNIWKL